jgi:hypothetical protein
MQAKVQLEKPKEHEGGGLNLLSTGERGGREMYVVWLCLRGEGGASDTTSG